MPGFIRRNSEVAWLGVAIVANLMLCAWLLARNDWLTNVAFLILGALVAVVTTLISERLRRTALKRDLASALYVELSDRVARCVFDMENPWKEYLDHSACVRSNMAPVRLRKFIPDEPIVFLSSASQIAVLGLGPAQALVRFYYRLSALRRDAENIATHGLMPGGTMVDPKGIQLVAQRFAQSIIPGALALNALSPLVPDHAAIDSASLAAYDEYRDATSPRTGTLRDRLQKMYDETSGK